MTEAEYRKTLKAAQQFDIVRVRWRDSSLVHLGWADPDEYLDALETSLTHLEETTGYFVGANDGYVLVALSLTAGAIGGPKVDAAMMIPHEAVRALEILAPYAKLDIGPTPDKP